MSYPIDSAAAAALRARCAAELVAEDAARAAGTPEWAQGTTPFPTEEPTMTRTRTDFLAAQFNAINDDAGSLRRFFCRGGRTGTKIHYGCAGSSVLGCGKWVRHNVEHYRVDASIVTDAQLCERCFGPELAAPASTFAPAPTASPAADDHDARMTDAVIAGRFGPPAGTAARLWNLYRTKRDRAARRAAGTDQRNGWQLVAGILARNIGVAGKPQERIPPMSGGSPYADRGTGWHADDCPCRACQVTA